MTAPTNEALDAQGAAFQRSLSRWNALFLETAVTDGRYRRPGGAPLSFEGLPSHSWPTFVDTGRIQEWARRSTAMRSLILNAGVSLLPDRPPELAALFGYPLERAALVRRLLGDRARREAFASRGDFLLSGTGLKCCELDFGDVGLWHLDSVNTIFQHSPLVKEFVARSGLQVRERNPLRTVVHELVKLVARQGPLRDCNFAILVPDETSPEAFAAGQFQAAYVCSLYRAALRLLGLEGELVLARTGSLSFHRDHVSLDGQRLHVVMTQTPSLPAEAQVWAESPLPDLVERGGLCAVNGPDCSTIGNKIMLALVSEAADAGRLDAEDTALVRSTLPWTRRVRACRVQHPTGEPWLPDLLVSSRDDFVLKPGEGFASASIKIGRNTSASDWERAVATAVADGTWVAQEAVGGSPMWLLGAGEDLAPHGVNIGIVVCGDEYAGIFLRLMAIASPDEIPIIGYSMGALTGGVVEVNG